METVDGDSLISVQVRIIFNFFPVFFCIVVKDSDAQNDEPIFTRLFIFMIEN